MPDDRAAPGKPPGIPSATPPPGSDAALDAGCVCPIFDNAHGRGWMGIKGLYCYSANCPVHGPKTEEMGR